MNDKKEPKPLSSLSQSTPQPRKFPGAVEPVPAEKLAASKLKIMARYGAMFEKLAKV